MNLHALATIAVTALGILTIEAPGATAAELKTATMDAWNTYVADTETRIQGERAAPRPQTAIGPGACAVSAEHGELVGIPGGTIAHWWGAVVIPGASLDTLLAELQRPDEHRPDQEDVVALRVLARQPRRLRIFIRMTQASIVNRHV